MIALEQIQQLPLHEKFFVMEMLWADISRQEGQVETPQWHKDILDERERLLQEGKAGFMDWETAKQQIQDAIL